MPKYRKQGTIYNEILHIDELKPFFSKRETFSTSDLETFFKKVDPDISNSTINWRIRQLVYNGVIKRVGHGVYSLGKSKKFIPQLDQEHKKLYRELKAEFPYSDLSIWHTSILNRFMLHQPFLFMTIVEADTDSVKSVFYKMRELNAPVFLGEDHEMIERYGSPERSITIVKLLVSEAPTQETNGLTTVTLEKILVDLFCDDMIFFAFQGNERSIIFKNAFNAYTLNQNKLLRYAQRRGRRADLKEYLNELGLLRLETKNSI